MCGSVKVKPRIYVASLADYVAGTLAGRWIDATLGAEHIHTEIQAMLAQSEELVAEEWAIHDYEGFGGAALSEHENIDFVAELAAQIERFGPVFAELTKYLDSDADDLEPAVRYMTEGYQGCFESVEEFAAQFVDDCYGDVLCKLPEFLRHRLDYEGIARDLELGGDIFTVNVDAEVHVFRERWFNRIFQARRLIGRLPRHERVLFCGVQVAGDHRSAAGQRVVDCRVLPA